MVVRAIFPGWMNILSAIFKTVIFISAIFMAATLLNFGLSEKSSYFLPPAVEKNGNSHVINGIWTRPNVNRVSLMVHINIHQKKIAISTMTYDIWLIRYESYNMQGRLNGLLNINFEFSEIQYLYNIQYIQ